MNDPAVIELISRELQNENDLIVWGAARALGALGDASAIGPLKEALTRYDQAMRRNPRMTYVWKAISDALNRLNP